MILVAMLLLLSQHGAGADGPMTRGRVRVEGNTIVSDWGTPLRAACWGMDIIKGLFKREEVHTFRYCGLNAIHVYCELTTTDAGEPIGYNAARMDSIVEWCRAESVYVIMTHGGPILKSTVQKILDIWEFYAPRYADQTHVVYEVKNEGCYATYHCADDVMQMYIDAYKLIRKHAPETHVLLLSHSNLKGGLNALWEDIGRLGPDIDWTNASLAFHGYGTDGGFQEQAARALGQKGYGMTCTEFPSGAGLVKAYENAGISYCHFQSCWGGTRTPGAICGYLKGYGVSWKPDFGTWPQAHVEQIPLWVSQEPRRMRSGPDGAGTYRIFINGLPNGDVRAVYDLTGRLVWDGCTSGVPFTPGAAPRPLVVDYSEF
jgi:hypothetical protein